MEIIMADTLRDLVISVLGGLIGSLILYILLWSLTKIPFFTRLLNPNSKKILYPILLILCLLSYVFGGFALIIDWHNIVILSLFLLPLFLLSPFFLTTFRFLAVGINDADAQIKKGLNYKKALSLCHSQLSFLGTGASKLIKEEEFESTLSRCVSDRPIRFLLLKPDDATLVEAAKRAEKRPDEFENIVKGSLVKLARFKHRFKNIEVRFYSTKPVFRLMFIDDSICLLSYNIFGKGDGAQLPQVIISNAASVKKKEKTLYYPLSQYYEDIWNKSEEWNFTKYIGDEQNGT